MRAISSYASLQRLGKEPDEDEEVLNDEDDCGVDERVFFVLNKLLEMAVRCHQETLE